jgi:hypothetical protein
MPETTFPLLQWLQRREERRIMRSLSCQYCEQNLPVEGSLYCSGRCEIEDAWAQV